MKIDVSSIVEQIDIKTMIEEILRIKISEDARMETIVDNIFGDGKMEDLLRTQVLNTINEYLSSEDGKNYIIGKFKDVIDDIDLSYDDNISSIISEFLKKSLFEKLECKSTE